MPLPFNPCHPTEHNYIVIVRKSLSRYSAKNDNMPEVDTERVMNLACSKCGDVIDIDAKTKPGYGLRSLPKKEEDEKF